MYKTSNILRSKKTEVKGIINLNSTPDGKEFNLEESLLNEKIDIEKQIQDAKKQLQIVIEETEAKGKSILEKANVEAKLIEKKAYELGYEQGMKNGYEDGYKESYEANIDKAMEECESIKSEAYKNIATIKAQTKEYIKFNKEQVLKISISIAEQVLRERLEDTKSMVDMIENYINEYDLKNDLVIKVNEDYIEELSVRVNEMEKDFGLNQKIFVIADGIIEKGNAEIETKSGKFIIGIDSVLEKVKSELL